jgi:hypothetical protein
MMTREHVVWAGALCVEKQYGEAGPSYILHRIGALIDEDDINGVEMWAKIGEAFDLLASPSSLTH